MAEFEIPRETSLIHATATGAWNSMVKIDDTHVCMAFQGVASDGFIKTFSIDSAGRVVAQLNSLEHEITDVSHCSLVLIDSTHFILAYTSADGDGFLSTFSIDGSYVLTEIDNFEFDISDSTFNSLVKIDATHFALAYQGPTGDGFIKTFSIDGSYSNIAEIAVLEHDTADGGHNSLVLIDSTHLALAYAGVGGNGFIKTFSFDGSYENITEIAVLEHDTVKGFYNGLVLIDSTHLLLGYQGDGTLSEVAFAKTFSFDGSYENIAVVGSLEHDGNFGSGVTPSSVILLDGTHFIIAYGATGSDGQISTFSMDSDFTNIARIDTWEHDIVLGRYPSMVQLGDNKFVLGVETTGNQGMIKTFEILAADVAAGNTGGGGAPGVSCGGMW
ncbi:MAG TPA: hypothetical protein ENH62_02465 [Marinobacter sp.]|uniref:Uncharacterized protein n=1 Tax=marine sediment metagenome TaxID=412755 RepID=A0A0F9TBU1_9ZZZZ|nr:hypothetical protein [Marinobacter sp.]